MKSKNYSNIYEVFTKLWSLALNADFRHLHPHGINFVGSEVNFPVYVSSKDAKNPEIDGVVLAFDPSEDLSNIISASITFEGDFERGLNGENAYRSKTYDNFDIDMLDDVWRDFLEALETL